MSILGLENVIGYSDKIARAELDAGFFERFATHAGNRILAELQVPAGRAPRSGAVRAASKPEQDGAFAAHQHEAMAVVAADKQQ